MKTIESPFREMPTASEPIAILQGRPLFFGSVHLGRRPGRRATLRLFADTLVEDGPLGHWELPIAKVRQYSVDNAYPMRLTWPWLPPLIIATFMGSVEWLAGLLPAFAVFSLIFLRRVPSIRIVAMNMASRSLSPAQLLDGQRFIVALDAVRRVTRGGSQRIPHEELCKMVAEEQASRLAGLVAIGGAGISRSAAFLIVFFYLAIAIPFLTSEDAKRNPWLLLLVIVFGVMIAVFVTAFLLMRRR